MQNKQCVHHLMCFPLDLELRFSELENTHMRNMNVYFSIFAFLVCFISREMDSTIRTSSSRTGIGYSVSGGSQVSSAVGSDEGVFEGGEVNRGCCVEPAGIHRMGVPSGLKRRRARPRRPLPARPPRLAGAGDCSLEASRSSSVLSAEVDGETSRARGTRFDLLASKLPEEERSPLVGFPSPSPPV